jgi:hypothetical protein
LVSSSYLSSSSYLTTKESAEIVCGLYDSLVSSDVCHRGQGIKYLHKSFISQHCERGAKRGVMGGCVRGEERIEYLSTRNSRNSIHTKSSGFAFRKEINNSLVLCGVHETDEG